MTRSREPSDTPRRAVDSRPSEDRRRADDAIDLLDGLPQPSAQDRDALWRARAPRRLPPEELAALLLAWSSSRDERAWRERPVSGGQPFEL
jgi:hypothetical protein